MNILLINHYAGSPNHGMEFRPYYLAREWLKLGHRVMIIAGSYSHVRNRQPELGNNGELSEIIEGIQYEWHRTPVYEGNGIGRVASIVSFLWAIWKHKQRIGKQFKPDVVIASSTYPMDIWPAHSIARAVGAKLIFEVHDLWPLSPVEIGGMSRWNPFILVCQRAEDFAYRHADLVVSLLPKAKPYMQSRGLSAEKFHYVPNGIDPDEWSISRTVPDQMRSALNLAKKRGKPVVGYAGAHGLANSLDVLLDAAKILSGRAHFILVGAGPERQRLVDRVRKEDIRNVNMVPSIPKTSVPAFLSEIDIAFLGLSPQPLFRFGISPNKIMDYMMAAKPIVMAIDAGNDLVSEAGCGITVPPGDANAVSKSILELIDMPPETLRRMGERGRKFVLREHAYPILGEKFADLFHDEHEDRD